MAVLAATLVDVVDFLPVVFLYGVSKFLFSALALAFCLSLLASFVVAMTVIPLFCSRFLKQVPHATGTEGPGEEGEIEAGTLGRSKDRLLGRSSLTPAFNRHFNKLLDFYEYWVRRALVRPGLTVALWPGCFWPAWRSTPFWAWPSSRAPTPGNSPSTSRRPPARALK